VSPEPVAALEALLFASPEPLPRERLAELLPELSAEELAAALAALRARYASPQSGLMLDEVAGGFRLGLPILLLIAGVVIWLKRRKR